MSGRVKLALTAIVALHVALATAWLAQHELPQGGRDEFFIVEVATELGLRLADGDGWDELKRLILDAYYPPGTRLPGVVAIVLGGGYDAMVAAQWVLWLPLLVGGTFVVGRRLGGDVGGLTAVALLLAGPGMADGLHRFEPTLGPTAAAACVLAAWLHSEDLTERRTSLLFGLFLGLGLMSDRLGVLPFAIVPVALSVVRTRGANWRGVGIAAVAALLVCGWWYADFVQRFANELLPQLRGGEITATGDDVEDAVPALWFVFHYVVLWFDTQLGLVGGAAVLAGVLWAVARPERGDVRDVLIFGVGGLALFTLVPKRQAYYTMPLLPAFCALAGALAADLWRADGGGADGGPGSVNGAGGADGAARRRAAVVAVLVAATVPNMVCATGRTPDLNRGLASWLIVGQSPIPERLLVQRYPMGGPPVDAGLDMDGAMAALGPAEGDVVATFSFDSQVSESFLVSLGRLARRDPKVVGVCLHPESVAAGPRPRGLIVATRGGDGWPTGALIRRSFEDYYGWDDAYEAVIARLDELRASATLVEQRDLAQGETLTVWRIAPGP